MSVHSWGTGKSGELGAGDERWEALDPIILEFFRGKHIRRVCCGEFHSLAVADLGDLFVWGRGREGQLGNGVKVHKATVPSKVWTLRHERIVNAMCGYYHCLAITISGRLYQWGKLYKYVQAEDSQEFFSMAVGLSGMQQQNTKEMVNRSTNQYYSAGISEEDAEEMKQSRLLQNFGNFTPILVATPELVPNLNKFRIVEVAAGYSFTLAITSDGQVFSWGFNDKFQLGLGHRYPQETPVHISALKDVFIVSGACGQQHSVLLDNEGQIHSFGLGVFGQLGHGTLRDERRPRLLESLCPSKQSLGENTDTEEGYEPGERIVQVACGSHHTLALGVSGTVWTWGSAEYGQQGGMNAYEDWATGVKGKSALLACAKPRSLKGCFHGKHIASIACGHLHNIAITREGAVWTWGWGSYGVLGHGNHRYLLVPKQIRRLGGELIAQVSAGPKHVLAVNTGSSTTFAFDFKSIFNMEQFSDISFFVEGKRFFGHKAIIFSRCPYLRSYVTLSQRYRYVSSDKDEETNVPTVRKGKKAAESEPLETDIVIEKVRHQIFIAIMLYLYIDHLQVAPHLIEEVQHLARQYKLPRLVGLCARHMLTREEAAVFSVPPSTFSSDLHSLLHEDIDQCEDIIFTLYDESSPNNIQDNDKGKEKESEKVLVEERISAHKAILVARSEYFKRIFNSGFRESNGGISGKNYIPLEGMSKQVFLTMLDYIYTGYVTSPTVDVSLPENNTGFQQTIRPDIVVELLMAADRFLLDDLKQLCEGTIEESIDIDNVSAVLELSERTSAPRLKRASIEFITTTWEDTQKTQAFNDLVISSPHLVAEIQAAVDAYLGSNITGDESSEEDDNAKPHADADADAKPNANAEKEREHEAENDQARILAAMPALVGDNDM